MIRRILAIFIITLKRLLAQRGLTLATTIGLITAVALISSVPLYADAVYFRILNETLSTNANRTNRPPFAYMFTYIGAWYEPIEWETTQPIYTYLSHTARQTFSLPQEFIIQHLETPQVRLYPSDTTTYSNADTALARVNFATTSGIEQHIEIIEGQFPQPTDGAAPIEILLTDSLAAALGIQVGDIFTTFNPQADPTTEPTTFPVRVAGVWQPLDPQSDYWFYTPDVFDDLILVDQTTFAQQLSPLMQNEVNLAVWYLVFDGSQVKTSDVARLVHDSRTLERRADTLLPNTIAQISPVEALQEYQRSVSLLTISLFAFNVPILGLVLAFIGLVVGLSVNERRNEIAIMRSRGATPGQIIGIAILEGVIIGLVALGLGVVGGAILTKLMGQARSFLNFSADVDLRVLITEGAVRAGVVAMGLALLAQVLPTIAAAQHTIITYKQERARSLQQAWWQRVWLDLLLFLISAYGFYQLEQQGSIVLLENGSSADPFQNPLLFLVPAFVIFSVTLLFLRLMPLVMGALSWLLAKTDSVGLLLATRHLARTPRFYATPLILLVLTMSLSVFSASVAQTLDLQLFDQVYYRVGSDLRLSDFGGFTSSSGLGPTDDSATEVRFFLPVSEYEEVAGVEAATRVGRYAAIAQVGSDRVPGTFYGIDRANFNQVAYWRWDFAPNRLGSLLNLLALSPDSVLVSRDFLRQQALRVGDLLRLDVQIGGDRVETAVQIVGAFDYFPTWYPQEDGPLFVGNLDNLFEQAGTEFSYHVWLRTADTFDQAQFEAGLRERQLSTWQGEDPVELIHTEQIRPERQGLFGLLSVGFVAAALLTVLGFFLYALFSFRRRFIELGILRAVGLSARQMIFFLAWELASLIIIGLTLGTALGVFISQEFIPYLQFGTSEADLVPPYLVEIAWPAIWQIYILFGLLFLAALTVLGFLLLRMKIFQAVKLGETA